MVKNMEEYIEQIRKATQILANDYNVDDISISIHREFEGQKTITLNIRYNYIANQEETIY